MILTRIGLLAPLLLLSCTGAAPDPQVIGFPSALVETHRLAGSTIVAVPTAMAAGYAGEVRLIVTIDTRGNVTNAVADKSGASFGEPAPAIAAARQWKFRPFEYRGHPVTVMASIGVQYRLREAWADPQARFPAIDYATLRIELTRTACLGPCPIYKVSIAGDGTVTYKTHIDSGQYGGSKYSDYENYNVLVGGERRTRIDRATLDGLIAKFRAARFFGLKKDYSASGTDNPAYLLRFSTGGQAREVQDYVGRTVDMPEAVTALEDEIDRVAGTVRWVKGDGGTVAALLAGGFAPRSPAAADLAGAALKTGGDAVVLDLLAAGMPLERMVTEQGAAPQPLGVKLLYNALRFDRTRAARALIARGWLAKMPAAQRATLFAETAGGCDPVIARAFIAAGVDPNAHARADPDWGSTGGGTALHAARARFPACASHPDRIALTRMLLALGVDPNLTDKYGETPIFGVTNPALLDLLLASGARANVKGNSGNSPALDGFYDLIVLKLLEAGADPAGKDYQGKTLPMLANEPDMPATRAWLAAHGIR
jgi:hypothetical protein